MEAESEGGFFDGVARKVDDFFMPDEYKLETDTGYERRIWDREIEGYLDAHFDEYISTYQIVTSTYLEELECKCEDIEIRTNDIKSFVLDIDANVSNLEIRVDVLKEKSK